MTKQIRTYRVHYVAGNGKHCTFKFETDASFKTYYSTYAQSVGCLGTPFFNAMMDKVFEIEAREDSAMKRNGGFCFMNIRMIECLETKRTRYFINSAAK